MSCVQTEFVHDIKLKIAPKEESVTTARVKVMLKGQSHKLSCIVGAQVLTKMCEK